MPTWRPRSFWLWGILIVLLSSCGGKRSVPYMGPEGRFRGVYHVVERGQTFWRICKAYGVNMQYVAEVNNIRDVTQIRTGQRIFIPGAKRRLKVEPYVPPADGIQESVPKVETYKGRFIWPVRGSVSSPFGVRNGIKHAGVDIATPKGSPVVAAASGKVIYRGKLRGYGKILILRHADSYTTVYAHLNGWRVKDGQWVKQGDVIAAVGDSGRSSGAHLHFEIRLHNRVRNPSFYLP